MFEHRSQKLLPRNVFVRRLLIAFGFTLVVVFGSLLIGTCGYRWFANFYWEAAFHQACLVLAGHKTELGVVPGPARVFDGIFNLYARLVFVTMVAIILAPLLHRLLHRLNLESEFIGEE